MTENPYALKQSSDYVIEQYTCAQLRDAWNEGYNQGLKDIEKGACKSLSIGNKLWDNESIRITLKLKAQALRKKVSG